MVRRDNYVKLFSKAMGLDVSLLSFVYVRGEEMRRVFQNWNTQQNEVRIDGGLQTVEETQRNQQAAEFLWALNELGNMES